MHVCFCFVCFSFSVVSQQIGWEEHLQNDLLCVEWDVKFNLHSVSHSISLCKHLICVACCQRSRDVQTPNYKKRALTRVQRPTPFLPFDAKINVYQGLTMELLYVKFGIGLFK